MSSQNPAKILPRVSAHQERWQLVCEWKWLLGFLLCLSSAQSASRLSGSAWCSAGASDKSGWLTASSVERGLHLEGFSQCLSCDSQARLRISTWVAGNLKGEKKRLLLFKEQATSLLLRQISVPGFPFRFWSWCGAKACMCGAESVVAQLLAWSRHCASVWKVEEQSHLVFTAFLVWKPVQWPYTLLRWRFSFVFFFFPLQSSLLWATLFNWILTATHCLTISIGCVANCVFSQW